jgi:hypothetical protein
LQGGDDAPATLRHAEGARFAYIEHTGRAANAASLFADGACLGTLTDVTPAVLRALEAVCDGGAIGVDALRDALQTSTGFRALLGRLIQEDWLWVDLGLAPGAPVSGPLS